MSDEKTCFEQLCFFISEKEKCHTKKICDFHGDGAVRNSAEMVYKVLKFQPKG